MRIHALAGLHAGIVGVFWMFGCFVAGAFWGGHSVWSVPNLFATVFYGDDAFLGEFVHTTWSGIALILALYGAMGALWGCWWKQEGKPFLRLFGALTGVAIYYLFFDYIWAHVDPSIPMYAPVRELQAAHALWGAALASSPAYSRSIARAIMPPEPARPDSGQDAAESVSGELIR